MQSLDVISINFWNILISLLNLVILFLILKKFLFKPVKNMLASRQQEVDNMYNLAQTANEEANANKKNWEEKMKDACTELFITTDDGTLGEKGFVTQVLERIMNSEKVDYAIAVGPLPMMRAVAELTRDKGIYTEASMNPIMVDGTGMCGACRVTVGGETKFACVDGPDFNAHLIDFDEVINRSKIYKDEEKKRSENCNLLKMATK